MAIAQITTSGAHVDLAAAFADVAARLCRSTVQVRGRGPGGGSGVIWRPDGVIITNAHVARGDRAIVELWDGRELEGAVTARNPRRDLAAIKIEASGLPAAGIGDATALRVGELVLAIGNPLGLVGALTTGIVHAITSGDGRGEQHWVRADVRLAPGNSGGPLADALGNVIGINSMIAGGLALAVPSNDVEQFLSRRAERPYLGVSTQPVLVPLGGQRAVGLLVLETAPGGAAEAAGLLVGDVLIGAEGKTLEAPEDLLDALYAVGSDNLLRLDLLRGGRRMQRDVALSRGVPAEAPSEGVPPERKAPEVEAA